MKNSVLILFLIFSNFVFADNAPLKEGFNHESEVSIVDVSGNSSAETYSVKQKTVYKQELNSLSLTANYLDGRATQQNLTTGVLSSADTHKWDAGIRYDRNFNEKSGAFLGQLAESDESAGYTQRDNTDLGLKYLPIIADDRKLQTELGYRYTKTNGLGAVTYTDFVRAYVEYTKVWNPQTSGKIWIEHLFNTKESAKYLTNYEASITVVLNSLLSMKVAYLAKFHNYTVAPWEKQLDSIFTTALVAKL